MDEHEQTVGNFLDGRHAKAAARIAELEAEMVPPACCQEWESCTERCTPLATELRRRIAELEDANCTLRNSGITALERREAAEAERDAAIKRAEAAEKDAARYAGLKRIARRIDFDGLCVSDMAQLDRRLDAALAMERERER